MKAKAKSSQHRKTLKKKKPGKFQNATTLGERLRRLREGSTLSERTLEMLTGISAFRITQLEENSAKPTSVEVEELARVFKTTLEFIGSGKL